MALSQIPVPPDAKRDAKARALAPRVASLPRTTLKRDVGAFDTGTVFYRVASSDGRRFHHFNCVACDCPDYQLNGRVCYHVRAAILDRDQAQAQATRRPRYEEIFGLVDAF